MDWKAKMRMGLDVSTMTGAEIGPLTRPAVTKSEGEIFYVDHVETQQLMRKYAGDPNVNVAEIVEVDVVWGERTLAESFGPGRKLDYVIASHVIEHVPDMITWFEELRSVLRRGGRVNLIVPDRRFTFDLLREETRLGDLVAAYLLKTRRPLPQQILDFCLNSTSVELAAVWEERLDSRTLRPTLGFDDAVNIARDSIEAGNYHDVHCWVFTPRRFGLLCEQLAQAGLLHFACDKFFDTEPYMFDFAVSLCESDDRVAIVESWREMSNAAKDDIVRSSRRRHVLNDAPQAIQDIAAFAASPGSSYSNKHLSDENVRLNSLLGEAAERERLSAVALSSAEARIGALENSTSWRLTRPVRTVGRMLKARP